MRLIERVWQGDDALSRVVRTALIPLEGVYRVVVGARGWMYDHGLLRVRRSALHVISVGNVSVGGTGKTPFAAWVASELAKRGARPAVVLRGYGGDEPLVHARLNPEIPVIVAKRRADGIVEATQLGASVAVLDDAFQHRSAQRSSDIVLVAAEQWEETMRLLPAGPWREPLSSVRRSAVVVITRKTADSIRVKAVSEAIARVAPEIPQAVARFDLVSLRRAETGGEQESLPIIGLSGRRVIAIAGVAQPSAFFQQLTDVGAVVTPFGFPDHHRYSAADVSRVMADGGAGNSLVVCTLKDAVKLAPLWPATGTPLWYVLQGVEIESGGDALSDLLRRMTPRNPAED